MLTELTQIILPTIAFFLLIFLVFSFFEAAISVFLTRVIFGLWGIKANIKLQNEFRKRMWIKPAALAFLIFFVIAMGSYTAFLDVLRNADAEVKVFAVESFLLIILMYLASRRRLPKFSVVHQVHRYLYFYLSIFLYILAVVLTNSYYDVFKGFINASIIVPISENRELVLENRTRKELLAEFRQQIYRGLCDRVDFISDQDRGNKQFLFITSTPELGFKAGRSTTSRDKYFKGRYCTNGFESFLLTDYGDWFWVFETGFTNGE